MFDRDRNRLDGLQRYCKMCAKEIKKNWRKINSERLCKERKEYYKKNIKKIKNYDHDKYNLKIKENPNFNSERYLRQMKPTQQLIQRLARIKGCMICRTHISDITYDFHHCSEVKNFSLRGACSHSREKIKKELKLCVPLCHSHHTKVTSVLRGRTINLSGKKESRQFKRFMEKYHPNVQYKIRIKEK